MKKDIPVKKVEEIAVAIVPSDEDPQFWDAFLINLKDDQIKNVLITSRGYGEKDGEKVETNRLRYYYELIGPEMAVKIEPIDSNLFTLTNEYWISFQLNGHMYDKKYVFVRGSFLEVNYTNIPLVNKKGIMIK